MDQVVSLDSSRDLQLIHAKNFINRLHLVLHTCVETFDVIFFLRLRIYGVRTKRSLCQSAGRPQWPLRAVMEARAN